MENEAIGGMVYCSEVFAVLQGTPAARKETRKRRKNENQSSKICVSSWDLSFGGTGWSLRTPLGIRTRPQRGLRVSCTCLVSCGSRP